MPWWLPASLSLSLVALLVGGALVALGFTAGALNLGENLGQPYLWRVVWFTVWQAALSTFLSVSLAIPLARALARRDFPGRGLLLRLFSLSLVVPVIVAIFGIVAVHGGAGWVNDGLEFLGLSGVHYLYGLGGILIGHCFFNLPFVARVLLQALDAVPPETWRVASQYGLRSRDLFRLIEWPAMRTVLPGIAGLVFMLCFTSFAVVLTLGGGPRATTLEVAVYQALRFDFDLGRAVTLALVQLLLCGGLVLALLRFSVPSSLVLTEGRVYERPDRAGLAGRLFDAAVIALALVFVLLPLVAVALAGFNPKALSVLEDPRLWQALGQSLVIAIASAVLALLSGGALLISSRILRHRLLRTASADRLELSASLILVVPPFVLATGLFVLLRPVTDVFALGLPLVVLVNALMALPFVVRFLGGPMMEEAQRHDRLCQSLGIGGWARLRLVEWPNLRRPIALALAVAATLSLGDLGVIALFGSQDLTTLPLLLYQAMGGFRMAEAAVIAAVLSLVCLLLFLIIEYGLVGSVSRRECAWPAMTEADSKIMLEVSALTFRYEDLTMRFDLKLARGECLALLGPSGAGKSTLLSLIAGFERPLSGRIAIDGRDVTGLSPAERPVTSLFQEHNLFAHLTVAENVGLGLDPGLRLTAEQQETIARAMQRVGLAGLERRRPAQLSGGQRQRVALARSLVRRRPLLLLDEPFSALDPGLRLGMLDLVEQLRREQGLTVLLVSHNPQDALRIAGQTAFVCDGEIAVQEPTAQLLARREPAALRAFLGAPPLDEAQK